MSDTSSTPIAQYHSARISITNKMPLLTPDRRNQFTESDYVTIDRINKHLVPLCIENNIYLSFKPEVSPIEDHRRVTLDIVHVGGHMESISVDVPIDHGKKKSEVQAAKSSITYARRILLECAFNLSTGGDNDAHTGEIEPISNDQISRLLELIEESGADKGKLLQHYNVESVADLSATNYESACRKLNQRVKMQNTA